MSSLNQSTGFSPFQLCFSKSPHIIPPLISLPTSPTTELVSVHQIIKQLHLDVSEAKDNLHSAKINQAYFANKHRSTSPTYSNGSLVMLSTLNRCRKYKNGEDTQVAKFMPRFDGPYVVISANEDASTVTLDIPNQPNIFPTFHTSLIKPFNENDNSKFPSHTLENPGLIIINGEEEFFMEKILDHKKISKGYHYLVCWSGYGPSDDHWICGADLEDNIALDNY